MARLGADYWRLWTANAISSVGDGAFATALPLLAVTVTRDPRLISLVSAASYLPWLLVSLPAGSLIDRHDRTMLMWRAQVVQGLAVGVIMVLLVITEQETGQSGDQAGGGVGLGLQLDQLTALAVLQGGRRQARDAAAEQHGQPSAPLAVRRSLVASGERDPAERLRRDGGGRAEQHGAGDGGADRVGG